MKCQKCGFEVNDDDLYCQNCGEKIVKIEKVKEKSKKIKISKIGVVALAAIIIAVILAVVMVPKDIEVEAKVLANAINEEEVDEYRNANLFVHGYLMVDTRDIPTDYDDVSYYMISSTKDVYTDPYSVLDEGLMFIFEEGFPEDLGTGSEVILQGKLRDNEDETAMEMLIVESYEVIKKEEPVYLVDIYTLNESVDKYVNKKIITEGRMINIFGAGQYLFSSDLEDSIQLEGLTETEYTRYIKQGSYAIVTGTLSVDANGIHLKVENVTQNDDTYENSFENAYTVSECNYNYFEEGAEVSVCGIYSPNKYYAVPYALTDESGDSWITISNFEGNINLNDYLVSGGKYIITGNIYSAGAGYVLEIIAIG